MTRTDTAPPRRRQLPDPGADHTGRVLRAVRRTVLIAYLGVVAYCWYRFGIPLMRSDLLVWLAPALLAVCIGRRPVWILRLAVDFVPFAAVLVVYDYLRGWAGSSGLPTWWHPQLDLDHALFLGHQPSVWLQAHLKHVDVRWYDVAICLCYYSFFFLPYVTAAVLWARNRADFYRWTLRFVALSFVGFALFVLLPTAPPWAAALCRPAQVAAHPNNPACMALPARPVLHNLLGSGGGWRPGANPFVERIVTRGFDDLHLRYANVLLVEGRIRADAVAAVPSLHVGGTMLFVLFVWPRVNRWWRPLLVAYPLVMTSSLVYAAEHYVVDCVAGALVAWLVYAVAGRIEGRYMQRRRPLARADTLDSHTEPMLET